MSRIVFLLVLSLAVCAADEVTNWNLRATKALVAAGIDDINQTRALAIMHIAVHDVLNAIEPRYDPYLYERMSEGGSIARVAVAAAAHEALVALAPSQKQDIDAGLQMDLAAIADSPQKTAAIRLGQTVAQAILARRASDGSTTKTAARVGMFPGQWRPTPPELYAAFLPHWGTVTPFGIRSAIEFRADPPPDLGSLEWVANYNEVKIYGAEGTSGRTAEQSDIARFWYETSAQGWNRIARTVAESRSSGSIWDTARLFALVNIALADSYIASLETKYYYNFWRPVTAIREGDLDGNPATRGSLSWSSFLFTPPIPDWPSAHASAGGAATEALAAYFQSDYIAFSLTSGAPYPGITRSFYSFSDAALENAHSRVLAGIHFRSASMAGLDQGRKVGKYIVENYLRQVRR
ncbi:MAG: vanadium-dependent haloperoxidase [Bryobacteraceae bacterium]